MTQTCRMSISIAAAWTTAVTVVASAIAAPTAFCITCTGPERTYACTVNTSRNDPGEKVLQLYCIARSAADGGHKSCSAARLDAAQCKGTPKTYTYNGPEIPASLQSAIEKRLKKRKEAAAPVASDQESRPKTQDTLIDLTTRTIKSTREGVGKAGSTVKGAGEKIGGAIRGTGRVVGDTIRSTAEVVGSAANYTYNCVFSLFRNCSADARSEDSEAPR